MKLLAASRVALGDRALAFPHPPTACLRADGSALAIIARGDEGWRTEIVLVDESGVRARATVPEGVFGSSAVILDRQDAGIVVLVDDRNALLFDSELASPRECAIVDADANGPRWGGSTVGGIARAASDGEWLVILSDPTTFQNARTIARLRIDDDAATWIRWELLDGRDYPMASGRRSTAPNGSRAPIVGDVLETDGVRYVAVPGSDTMSVNKYGADFFTLAELDADGRVARRLYEERDGKKQPGKHGIRARFTSDDASAILSPVFSSGEWKGRSRILSLADGALDEVTPIRGAAGFTIVDVRGDRALLASDGELLFATIAAD